MDFKTNKALVYKLFDSLDMQKKNGIESNETFQYIDKYFKKEGIECMSNEVFEYISKQEYIPDWFREKYKDYIK